MDAFVSGGGAVRANLLSDRLEVGDPLGVLAGFISRPVFALPQRQGFRFECVMDLAPIFARQTDHAALRSRDDSRELVLF